MVRYPKEAQLSERIAGFWKIKSKQFDKPRGWPFGLMERDDLRRQIAKSSPGRFKAVVK